MPNIVKKYVKETTFHYERSNHRGPIQKPKKNARACYYCEKPGHIQRYCYKRINDEKASKQETDPTKQGDLNKADDNETKQQPQTQPVLAQETVKQLGTRMEKVIINGDTTIDVEMPVFDY